MLRLAQKQVPTHVVASHTLCIQPGSIHLVHLQVDDRQLLVLISQLRLNSPQAKPQLQRVIYNLGQHHGTLRAVLRLVLALLRSPLSPDEAEAAMEEDGARAPRSLHDALQVMDCLNSALLQGCGQGIMVPVHLAADHAVYYDSLHQIICRLYLPTIREMQCAFFHKSLSESWHHQHMQRLLSAWIQARQLAKLSRAVRWDGTALAAGFDRTTG